jgi:hypothetical protein
MGFSRFVWLLQNKQLWLSRADMLNDPWEMALAGEQLAHVIARHPPLMIPLPAKLPESAIDRSKRIAKLWRQTTFISCWSASDHESHALWRIYCGPTEGVAIQTTFGRLRKSVDGLPLYPVTYETPGSRRRTPTPIDLFTKKRPMYEYEHEVRIVFAGEGEIENDVIGHRIKWDPEKSVELIRVHPEADHSFMQTVAAAVEHYAPALKHHVAWSAMKERPPLDPKERVLR